MNNLTSESRTIGGSGTAVTTSLIYDAANRLGTIVDKYGTTGLATFVYGYDPGNRLTSEVDTEIAGGVTYTYNATYAYDSSNELTTVTALRNGSSANESYGYDSGGNRNTTGYTTGGDNALTAAPGYTYTYDAEGNMTGQTQTSTHDVWTYSYDDRNRLTGVVEKNSGGTTLNQATYTYDALDRRIGLQDNSGGTSTTTWTVLDGVEPYADFSGSTTSTVTQRYLAAPGMLGAPLARTDSGGNSAWYLTDHLGSVRDVVNASGSVIDHVAYDSFGNIVAETSPSSGDRFKYAGMIWDATVGQYLAEHRGYSPLTGRFDSQDPAGFSAGDSDLYRYVGNNPIDYLDARGLQEGQQANSSKEAQLQALQQQSQALTDQAQGAAAARNQAANALNLYPSPDPDKVKAIYEDAFRAGAGMWGIINPNINPNTLVGAYSEAWSEGYAAGMDFTQARKEFLDGEFVAFMESISEEAGGEAKEVADIHYRSKVDILARAKQLRDAERVYRRNRFFARQADLQSIRNDVQQKAQSATARFQYFIMSQINNANPQQVFVHFEEQPHLKNPYPPYLIPAPGPPPDGPSIPPNPTAPQ